ncbi:MAG TPA: alcohol dehydrogenase [Chloroflexi bacterium]|nr:alcohol dehydrogenase [Chloroflexota bacterium]
MKAILLYEHGGPEVLTYGDFETPEPGYGEVQVQIKAAAMNRLDIWVRNGWPGLKLEYPHILGADGAGIVSATGGGVTQVTVGDRVVINGTLSCGRCEDCLAGRDNLCRRGGILGEDRRGTYAEYVVVPERNVLTLPEHISFEEAAAASLVFMTAWHSLITRGNLKPGESVLIVGAGGGVNTASIQIARLAGATVYVVGSTDEKLTKAQELGADFVINRSTEDWGKAIYRMTDKRGVDVVVDNVGKATWPTSLRALARGGRLLTVGGTSGYDAQVGVNYVFGKHLSIIGSTMAPHADFRTVMNLIFEGKLRAVIDRVMPMEEIAAACELLESGAVFGKLVLTP